MTSQLGLQEIARQLGNELEGLDWPTPSYVYNPLQYAWSGHREYLDRYGGKTGCVLLLGMNPGPWGMAQTGVPFGSISAVRDWFAIATELAQNLPEQHPKYPICGMRCHRDEGSGQRLWGWAEARFGPPERFFERFFVWNYCPLLFLSASRNLTPAHLSASESRALGAVCDRALQHVLEALQPQAAVGIGRYAEKCLKRVAEDCLPIHYLLHPSPANPTANRCWRARAEQTLAPWLPADRNPGNQPAGS
jgi:single-strand selective monofunctional uracil DNA glycosylase